MSASLLPPSERRRRAFEAGPWLAGLGVLAALVIGLAAGFPTTNLRVLAIGLVGMMTMAAALLWPLFAMQVLYVSSIFLLAWVVTGGRAINPIDMLVPPIFVASLFSGVRRRVQAEDRAANALIHERTRRLEQAVVIFYGLAVLSLVLTALRGHVGWALDSSLTLIRGLQGIAFFPLALWWMRTDREMRLAERALEFGAWLLIVVDVIYSITVHIPRAGMTWVLNMPEWPITSANEAAISLLMVWAILLSRPARERGVLQKLLIVAAPIVMTMTQSRSGLIAWTVFFLFSVRWWRPRTLVTAAVIVGLVVLLAPSSYWGRLTRTVAPGSFEQFSSIIRIYGWQAALLIFRDHPIFGVGYLGFRFFSSGYNDLRIIIHTCENYYLEIATGMGLVGLFGLGRVLISWFRLGRAVMTASPVGSHGYELGRRHAPLLLALLVANLTADQFMGITGLAQVSVWTALVIRAGQLSSGFRAGNPAEVDAARPRPSESAADR